MADERPLYILHPPAELEGCLTILSDGDHATETVGRVERERRCRRFRVRATISDMLPLAHDLRELLAPAPFKRIRLNEDPLRIYLHHGGMRAVYFTWVGDSSPEHYLLYIEVTVAATLPLAALTLGRAWLNRLLDSESANFNLPMMITRLDLLTDDDDEGVIASEVVLPYPARIGFGPLGGLDQSPLFTPWLAVLREGMTASSPYYRLLCAWRAYDGLGLLRKSIREEASRLGIAEPLPKDPEVDVDILRQAGASEEFLSGVRRVSDLFGKATAMRNAVAHFLLKESGHLYLSDGAAYRHYSIVSHVLLRAATQAIGELQGFYRARVESKTRIGSVLPERHRAHEYIVRDDSCPDS